MNQRKMQQMMNKMGIRQVDIPAKEVIIKTENSEIIISNPSVSKVNMMGQETFQIGGAVTERELASSLEITEEDIKTVADQAGVSEEKAKSALESSKGDIAKAILDLQEQ